MGDIIVGNKEVATAALGEGLVGQKDLSELGAYLKAYDLALDGKEDGGFSHNQIGKDAYLTVSTPLQKRDAQFGQRTHRLIVTLLEKKAQYQTAHPTFSENDSVLETGAKVLGAILFAPLGCGYSGESSNTTTSTTTPKPASPWCDIQECISSSQYRCDRPDGKKIVVSCPTEEQCEEGKCVTRPDYVDPTCGKGIRSVCEITDELDFDHPKDNHNLILNCFYSSKQHNYFEDTRCGDRAFPLYGSSAGTSRNFSASWNMRVLPPALASHYRLDFKNDWLLRPNNNPSLIIQFGDSQRQTIPYSSSWQYCVYQGMAVFSPDGVEDESINIHVWNGGSSWLSGDTRYMDDNSSVLALAKTRIWSCSCQQ